MDVDDEQTSEYQGLERFWSFIKSRREDDTSVASLKKNGFTTESPEGRANILNEQFESVFTREPDIPHDLSITESGVLKMLQQGNGSGPYQCQRFEGVSPIYSTHPDSDLSQILCHLKGARRLEKSVCGSYIQEGKQA